MFIDRIKNNPLLKYSTVLFFGNLFASGFNYIYHLAMGRMLGPVDYGILASLISIFYIIAVPVNSIMLIVAQYTSQLKAHANLQKLTALLNYFTKKLFITGLVMFVIFLMFSNIIADFLKIEQTVLIVVLATSFVITFLLPINRGILKGVQRFVSFTLSQIIEFGTKLLVAVALVLLGLKVYGALSAIVIGMLVAYSYTFFPIKKFVTEKKQVLEKIKLEGVLKYSLPVIIALLCLTLFYSSDVILVKHYLPAEDAGLYSALSTIGKVIYFATGAVAFVLFPLAAEKYAQNEKYSHLLGQSLLIVVGVSAITMLLYFLAPDLIVSILFGKAYLEIAPLLGYFAVFMSIFSLNNVLVNFYLAINYFKFIPALIFFIIVQIVILVFFHSSMIQIIQILITINSILLLCLTIFYLFIPKIKEKTTLPHEKTI